MVCALAGVLIERIAYHRLLTHNAERISLLITALGVSLFLQNLFMLLFKADAKNLQGMDGYIELGGLQITNTTLINIIVSVIMMVMLQLLVNKTKIGKAMQATSEDAGAAKLMGINTSNIILITFAVGSALAAVGAVLYCNTYPQIKPTMGQPARPEGICGSGAWRNRLDPRRDARRVSARCGGAADQSVHQYHCYRCGGVCDSDSGAAGEAGRLDG